MNHLPAPLPATPAEAFVACKHHVKPGNVGAARPFLGISLADYFTGQVWFTVIQRIAPGLDAIQAAGRLVEPAFVAQLIDEALASIEAPATAPTGPPTA